MKRDESNDVDCIKELIINDKLKNYLIILNYRGANIYLNETNSRC